MSPPCWRAEVSAQATVLCVHISSAPFMELVLPAALCPTIIVADLISVMEGLGRDVVVDYVWR